MVILLLLLENYTKFFSGTTSTFSSDVDSYDGDSHVLSEDDDADYQQLADNEKGRLSDYLSKESAPSTAPLSSKSTIASYRWFFSNFLLKLALKVPIDCFSFTFTDSIDPGFNPRCKDATADMNTSDICNFENLTDINQSGGDEEQFKITNNSWFIDFEAVDDSTDESAFLSSDTGAEEDLH